VEQALTNWGRASRFAGSGDRHAVRDLVYDAMRCRRSFAALGGAATGRGLILGGLRAAGSDPEALFAGMGHAPVLLSEAERHNSTTPDQMSDAERLDCPDWLVPDLARSLGADFAAVMQALQRRAPVYLRVNLMRISRDQAIDRLGGEGIGARSVTIAKSALEVFDSPRKIASSLMYAEGLVELQDAASQAVIEALPLQDGMRVLDFCAGGGGKALAMAARAQLKLTAHDVAPARLRDMAPRAARSGVSIAVVDTPALPRLAPFDLVLTDVPCSGSGAWRRAPEGKWTLTRERLTDLIATQARILDQAHAHLRPGGHLAYVTCSLLDAENDAQIASFLERHPRYEQESGRRLTPLDGGDGFFLSVLRRIH
jgi:16S rRNA (cytosine967-C5)-methyltransferase